MNLLLHNSSWTKRCDAAIALGSRKVKEAVPALIQALNYRDYNVRRERAKALGLIGDPGAKKQLAALAQNDNISEVRSAANQALRNIEDIKRGASHDRPALPGRISFTADSGAYSAW